MAKIKIRCDDCQKIISVDEDVDWESAECSNCQGSFSEYESSEDKDKFCLRCKNRISDNSSYFSCEICEEEPICNNCVIDFDEGTTTICKKCIDKKYPRKEIVLEKPIVKFIERKSKAPEVNLLAQNEKSRFD